MDIKHDARDLVEVKESTLKGLGVFAKVDIPRGTRVLAEPALLKVDRQAVKANDIVEAFKSLPSPQQSLYLELHGYACDSFKRATESEMGQNWEQIPEIQRTVLAIYKANAFGSVFSFGSRFNHSCVPNIHFAYNPAIEKETFHAIRSITAGEELTIMYINGTNRTRDQRQAHLNQWGFHCACPACEDTLHGKNKEKRRAQLFTLDQELALIMRLGTEKTYGKALRIAQTMAAIQKSEGLLNRELGVSYHDAARYSWKMNEPKATLCWVEKELEVDLYCLGEDHPEYKETVKMVEILRQAADASNPFDERISNWFDSHGSPTDSCMLM